MNAQVRGSCLCGAVGLNRAKISRAAIDDNPARAAASLEAVATSRAQQSHWRRCRKVRQRAPLLSGSRRGSAGGRPVEIVTHPSRRREPLPVNYARSYIGRTAVALSGQR